jgi:oligopeptide/dipeptide ABC transporter ATP-binding protein
MEMLLDVRDLHVSFRTSAGEVQGVRGVSFALKRGDVLAVVGESGSGKSVTALALMGLLPKAQSRISRGKVIFKGRDLLRMSERERLRVRGAELAMIFQDPMTSLNPTMRVGSQIAEGIRWHRKAFGKEALVRAREWLERVGIPEAERRLRQYPHEFSGGMRQRAMIAMALATGPSLLIADEPTTALDVTIQAQIMDLLRELQEKTGTSIILITHDLGVVAGIAHRVAVMYGGMIVETAPVDSLFKHPRHPYTWGLLASIPRPDMPRDQELQPIPGSPPDLLSPQPGCPFADRCPFVMEICHEEMPPVTHVADDHTVSCWLEDPRAPKIEKRWKETEATALG